MISIVLRENLLIAVYFPCGGRIAWAGQEIISNSTSVWHWMLAEENGRRLLPFCRAGGNAPTGWITNIYGPE
jgi:hypothetical protein